MIIRLTSTLTPDDENVVAAALFAAAIGALDLLPIGYALHVETSTGQEYKRSRPSARQGDGGPAGLAPNGALAGVHS